MLKRNTFLFTLVSMSLLACSNNPKKVAVWDRYLDYDAITEECSDAFLEDSFCVDSQAHEYKNELERPLDIVVPSDRFECPSYTDRDMIVRHMVYTLSFNKETYLANWVAWSLTSENSNGGYSRTDDFRADELLPSRYRVDESAYQGSGYDRGHMCPAADNKWSYQAMSESFLMSNMCPQDPELNQVWWLHLEEAERRWARQEGEVFICCGPIFNGSTSSCLGSGVRIPDAFFKVILSLRKGREKAIGFYYHNDARRQTMESSVRSVDEIEEITNYDFFVNVSDELEERIEKHSNLRNWN